MTLTKHARIRMQPHGIPRALRRFSKALDACMVCADGRVAMLGHRYRRVVRR
jgi:hypothetical protein